MNLGKILVLNFFYPLTRALELKGKINLRPRRLGPMILYLPL